MVEQRNFCVTHRECSHNIRKKLALLVTQQNYGKVWKKVERDGIIYVVQAYPNLPHVKRDEKWALDALNFIGDFNLGPDDCFKLNKDLDTYDISWREFQTANQELNKILRKEPEEMFFQITIVAGHGMHF